jgi:hypothetical protein
MKRQLLFLIIFFACNTHAQDYVAYHRVINRIDQDIVNNDYNTAIARFDSLYESVDFVFASHCFKALQLSCASKDSIHACKWLEKSFLQGVPLWMIRSNDLTKLVLNYASADPIIKHYDSLQHIYNISVNAGLRNRIDSLFEIDQQFTRKVNDGFFLFRYTIHGLRWLKNNKRQFELLSEIIDHYGFPGEKLIGLPKSINDSVYCADHYRHYGPFLKETHAYIMLIHYYSNPREDINQKLGSNIHAGHLLPYQYGALNDFMAKWGKKKYKGSTYYNVWHIDPNTAHAEEIDQRRIAIGLNDYEQQKRNNMIWDERMKSKKINAEILLE